MIPTGTADSLTYPTRGLDPVLASLDMDLRNLHRRAELLAAHHDPRTIPQGVGDAIHDAVVALADARTVLATVLL